MDLVAGPYTDIVVGATGTGVSRDGFGLPVKGAIDDLHLRVGALEGNIFGTALITFVSQTSFVQAISFGFTFDAPPQVFTEIGSGAGAAARWDSRAINITTTGFDMFVYRTDASDPAVSWTNIGVHWRAFPTT